MVGGNREAVECARPIFERFGEVTRVVILRERETRVSRGFGFVDMPDVQAREAMKALDRTEWAGRKIRVDQARERKPREVAA